MKRDPLNYFLYGLGIATIIWTFLYSYVIGKIEEVHQQEIEYLATIKQSKNDTTSY